MDVYKKIICPIYMFYWGQRREDSPPPLKFWGEAPK